MSDEPEKLFDAEVLEYLQDAIGDKVHSIVSLYLTEVPEELAQMQQALSQDDYITVGRLAHSLKSSSANLGAMQLSSLAAQLEHMIADGAKDATVITESLTKIAACFDQTRPMISKYAE